MTKKKEEVLYVSNGELEDISEDVEEILEDTEEIKEIGEDTDEILKRIDRNTQSQLESNKRQEKMLLAIQATKTAVWVLVAIWIIQFIIDKIVMWFMLGIR